MTVQRDYPDFQNAGDTGTNIIDSIQPVSDGEGASQSVFRRPSENLRSRTEVMREAVRDLHYHRDAREYVIHSTGNVSWAGTVLGGGTGILTNAADIYLRPFLTPASSVKASLDIGTVGVNQVTYSVATAAYASDGMNNVTVEHVDGGAGTTLTATISVGPVKRVVVTFDSANSAHDSAAVKAAVDAAVVTDTGTYGLNGKLDTTDNGVAAQVISAVAETRLEGTADQEAHRITAGTLDALTTGRPLQEGDSIAIWYRHVVEPAGGDVSDPKAGLPGGRWESNPDRGSDSVTLNLFITTDDPQKIPGALPLCKIVDDTLVFTDGTRVAKGAATAFGAASDVYLDDTNFAGANTVVNNGGIPNPLAAPYLQNAMDALDDRVAALRVATFTVTDGTSSVGGDFNGPGALESAISALSGSGGVIAVRRGTYTLTGPTYVVPAYVTIIGEERDAVVLNGISVLELSNNSQIHNLISNGAINVANGVQDVVIRRVSATQANDFGGTRMVADDVFFFSSPSGLGMDTTDAEDSFFRNIRTSKRIVLAGTNNHFEMIRMGTVPGGVSADASIQLSGTNNTYLNITAAPRAFDLSSGAVIRATSGTNLVVDGLYTDQTTSALTSGRAGMLVEDCVNCTFRNVHIEMGVGLGVILTELSGTDPNTNVVFENCSFRNNTTNLTDYLVHLPSADAHDCKVQFVDCIFDVQEQFHPLAFIGNNATTNAWLRWTRCQFFGAADTIWAGSFMCSEFESCTFTIKNPVDGGIRPLPGDNTGMTLAIWEFTLGGQPSPCRLYNCIFDFLDSEVEVTGSGDPDISDPFINFLSGEAYNTQLINLNNHISSNGTGTGLINVTNRAIVDGVRFHFTGTAPVQAGTSNLDALFNAGTGAKIRNVTMDFTGDDSDAPEFVNFLTLKGSAVELEVENITLHSGRGQLVELTAGVLSRSRFENCRVGSVTQGVFNGTIGMRIPQGEGNQFINCTWHIDSIVELCTFDPAGSYSQYLFQGCEWLSNVVMTSSDFIEGSGTTAFDVRFVGCRWLSNKATDISFSSGVTFTRAVGVGNTTTNDGAGGVVAPTFDPNYNEW